jgi:hypothetical protein
MQDWIHTTAALCLLELGSQLCSLLVWGEAYPPLCISERSTEYVTAELCKSLLIRSTKSSIRLMPSEMGTIPSPLSSEYCVERGLKTTDIPLLPSMPSLSLPSPSSVPSISLSRPTPTVLSEFPETAELSSVHPHSPSTWPSDSLLTVPSSELSSSELTFSLSSLTELSASV